MRKLSVMLVVALLAGASAFGAGTIRDNCGCGLGTMAMSGSNPTLLSQMVATFLNGLGSQTFAISSGTSDCDPPDGLVQRREMERFVSNNLDQLAQDVAQGRGDTLEALADLLEVPVAQRPDTFATLQANFDRIFPSVEVTPQEVVAGIEAMLRG